MPLTGQKTQIQYASGLFHDSLTFFPAGALDKASMDINVGKGIIIPNHYSSTGRA